jgi:hypothetical protein
MAWLHRESACAHIAPGGAMLLFSIGLCTADLIAMPVVSLQQNFRNKKMTCQSTHMPKRSLEAGKPGKQYFASTGIHFV